MSGLGCGCSVETASPSRSSSGTIFARRRPPRARDVRPAPSAASTRRAALLPVHAQLRGGATRRDARGVRDAGATRSQQSPRPRRSAPRASRSTDLVSRAHAELAAGEDTHSSRRRHGATSREPRRARVAAPRSRARLLDLGGGRPRGDAPPGAAATGRRSAPASGGKPDAGRRRRVIAGRGCRCASPCPAEAESAALGAAAAGGRPRRERRARAWIADDHGPRSSASVLEPSGGGRRRRRGDRRVVASRQAARRVAVCASASDGFDLTTFFSVEDVFHTLHEHDGTASHAHLNVGLQQTRVELLPRHRVLVGGVGRRRRRRRRVRGATAAPASGGGAMPSAAGVATTRGRRAGRATAPARARASRRAAAAHSVRGEAFRVTRGEDDDRRDRAAAGAAAAAARSHVERCAVDARRRAERLADARAPVTHGKSNQCGLPRTP